MDLRSDGRVLGGNASMVLIKRSSFTLTGHGEDMGFVLLLESLSIYSSRAAIAAS